jgi:hypothetical protein
VGSKGYQIAHCHGNYPGAENEPGRRASCCCDGGLPVGSRFGSKDPQRSSRDEVALKVEGVVGIARSLHFLVLAISASEEPLDLRTAAFLTPRAGLAADRPRSTANLKIALTRVTHCAATPLPPRCADPADLNRCIFRSRRRRLDGNSQPGRSSYGPAHEASQVQRPESRSIEAQLVGNQHFGRETLFLEQLAHQPER